MRGREPPGFVIPGCATELGFTRVRQYHCPSRQQPTWMRRPGIHNPHRGYGFRTRSLHSRSGMTVVVDGRRINSHSKRSGVLVLALKPADMLLGVELKPDPPDQIKLGFEEIDVMLLVLHQAFEQIA